MVTFGERLVGIHQVMSLRLLEMQAALRMVEAYEQDPATEALHVYRIARKVELSATVAALEAKLEGLEELLRDPEKKAAFADQSADVFNLDDYR